MSLVTIDNNFANFGNTSVKLLLSRDTGNDETEWHPVKEVDGISISRGIVKGSEWNSLKAVSTIRCAAVDVAAYLTDVSAMLTYDDNLDIVKILSVIDSKTSIRYVRAKPVFPTAARDFVVLTAEKTLSDGTIAIASRSVEHKDAPPDYWFVRAKTLLSGYIVRPISETECTVTMLAHLDLGGYVPAYVINMLAVDTPIALLKRLQEMNDPTTDL
jgi:hypothetical protein